MIYPDAAAQARRLTHRFVSNGVPLDDVQLIEQQLADWTGWYSVWEDLANRRMEQAAEAERAGSVLTAAELRFIAALEYHFGKFLFVHDMDVVRAGTAQSAGAYQTAIGQLPWPGSMVPVEHDGHAFPGILRLPYGPPRPSPIVIVVPGLDAAKEELHLMCEVLLRRGMATYVLDGPGQGESEFSHHLTPAWEDVAESIVSMLAARPEIDDNRIGVLGVSLGGYFAARAASRVSGLRAGVSVGGCYSVAESWANLGVLSKQAFRSRSGAVDLEDAYRCAGAFTLADAPIKQEIPFLVVHGGQDRLFDQRQAESLATHFAAGAELVIEPDGNHVLHNLAYRIRPLSADWLMRQLQVG